LILDLNRKIAFFYVALLPAFSRLNRAARTACAWFHSRNESQMQSYLLADVMGITAGVKSMAETRRHNDMAMCLPQR
jgi:hypothetical protein